MPSSSTRQRQAHTKSRQGCKRCKTRRRKCDEQHPTCGNCQRSGVTCSLGIDQTRKKHEEAEEASRINIDDLRLLYHWMADDGGLFSDHDSRTSKQERDRQTSLALSHPYLLHTILSITALELFTSDPTKTSFYHQAASHNLAALQSATPNVVRTDAPQLSEPVYLFSAFTSLYAFAEPPLRLLSPRHNHISPTLDDLLKAFRMSRGILAVSTAHATNLKQTVEQQRTRWPDETSEFTATLEADQPELPRLLALINSQKSMDDDQRLALTDAATRLFAILSLLQHRDKTHSSARHIQSWPMHVNASLLELWEAREPLAILILAYYAAVMSLRSNLWFFRYWPTILLEQVVLALDDQATIWEEYLEWPRRMVQANAIADTTT